MASIAGGSEGAARGPTGARRDIVGDGARLAALRALGLLDTAPEEDFDRYTRLAAELLGVPVSLVTLVDADRQFLKSQTGLGEPWARARQTPLSHSLCRHAVESGEALVVEDARRHPLVADNLAVRDMDVLAYAGMPLVLSDGHAVGALCAMDARPHAWSERELRILGDLAAALRSQLELRRVLAEQGLRDRLTGLPNRTLLAAQADLLLSEAGTGAAHEVFAACLGLDAFTLVNEAYGTDIGDRLLAEAAAALSEATDERHTLGRLGGDCFAVVGRSQDGEVAPDLAEELRAVVADAAFAEAGEPVILTATPGLAFGQPGERGGDLLARSAEGMRTAKAGGGGLRAAACPQREAALGRWRQRSALGGALRRGELRIVYQPIVAIPDGSLRGCEALVRWDSPELGPVPPSQFVPVAERTGDIVAIGEWVLREACGRLAAWRAAGSELTMSVNLAPLQLEVANLPEVVAGVLAASGAPPGALQLEITEGAVVGAGALETRVLERLREVGVRVALDDFGTGYSALGYLTRLPVDAIKVDRSFVERVDDHRPSAALVQAILTLAEGLRLDVVAEGVETPGQREALLAFGCPLGQGDLFGAPVTERAPARSVRGLIAAGARRSGIGPVRRGTSGRRARDGVAPLTRGPPHD